MGEIGLEEFLAARSAALLRVGFALTGDWQRAEDLLQTALVSSYRQWARIDDPEAYVRQVMVRAYLGWRRRRWSGEVPAAHPSAKAGQVDQPDQAHLAVELRGAVMGALSMLPARQRAVIVLRYYLDLSEEATAHMLNVSRGTVKSQASKGLTTLRASAPLIALYEEEPR